VSGTRTILSARHAVWAGVIAAAFFGALAYGRLPMRLFPDTSPPVVNVITAWPGAAAADVADGLLTLEEAFAALEGIVNVRHTAQDDLSVMSLEFAYGRPVELAAVDVQNAVAANRDRLPAGVREPQVVRFSTADRPIFTLGVRGPDLAMTRRLAEDVLAPRLQQIPGVAAVDVFGGAVPAVIVDADRRALEAHRIPLVEVARTVREQNTALPAGRVRTGTRDQRFRVESRAGSPEALAALPLTGADGSLLRLGDIARIAPGAMEDDSRFAIDGERAIALQIFETVDGNTVEVVAAVREAVAQMASEWPHLTFLEGEESATFTEQVVSNLLENVWQALALATVTIFLFLGVLRTSLVVAISLPLSYALTFAAMYVSGIELNLVTLTAVILAVGMVVDASVVVLENVVRRREADGLDPEDAAAEGTDEVRGPVLAGAATTAIVLVPLLFLDGFVGRTFGPLALTLLLAFTSSVIVALTVVPVLTLRVHRRGRVDRFVERLTRPARALVDLVRRFYLLLLRGALKVRSLTVLVALLALAAGLAGIRSQGMDVLPKMDGGSFFVSLETPPGTSLDETERVVRGVEAILAEQAEVVTIQSQIGFEPGMRSFAASGVQGPTQGFVTVTLTPRTGRDRSVWEVQAAVRARLAEVPGIHAVTVREMGNTAKSTTAAPVVVRLAGGDPLVLDRIGDEVAARLATVPGIVEPLRAWRLDQERTRIVVDPVRAGQLGLTPAAVAAMTRGGSDGLPAGELHDGAGSPLPVWVRLAPEASPSPPDLLAHPIFVPGHLDPVPLRSVARLEAQIGQGLITRDDLASVLEVSAFTDGRSLSFVMADVERALFGLLLPRDYTVTLTGERSDLAEARRSLGGALVLAVLGVYLLLVAQFRSFLHPLTVLLSVPLALSGVGTALLLAGKPVSMPVMVGLVLLVGIVVNNAILLVDFVRRAREAGADRRQALLDAVGTRFRPILMTSISTIVGMIPLAAEWALGAERFSPLAVAVIGGMASATLLTLVVIPVLYDLVEDAVDLGRRVRRLLRGRPAAAAASVLVLLGAAWPGTTHALPSAAAASVHALDLDEAIALATRHSLTLKDREDALAAAGHRLKESRARRLPRLDLQARYTRQSWVEPGALELPAGPPGAPEPDPVRLGDPVENVWASRLSMEQPLFTGGRIANGIRAAEGGVRLAEAQRAQDEAELRFAVTRDYLALAAALERVQVLEAAEEATASHETRVQRIAAEGRATGHDLAQAGHRVAQARLARLQAEGAAEVAEHRLREWLGLGPEHRVVPTEPFDDAGPARPEVVPVVAPAARPPEIEVARLAGDVREAAAAAERGALFPQVVLRAGVDYARPNPRHFPLKDAFEESWDASVILQWTAFDFGLRREAVRAAEREAAQIRRAADHAEAQARLALAGARHEHAMALRRLEVARAAEAVAEEGLRLAALTFEDGRATVHDVLEAEAARTSARAERIDARLAVSLAEARLARLGALLPKTDGPHVVRGDDPTSQARHAEAPTHP
jgi:multidrug efflux pump subunit AcrB/outer membrane protein TolC